MQQLFRALIVTVILWSSFSAVADSKSLLECDTVLSANYLALHQTLRSQSQKLEKVLRPSGPGFAHLRSHDWLPEFLGERILQEIPKDGHTDIGQVFFHFDENGEIYSHITPFPVAEKNGDISIREHEFGPQLTQFLEMVTMSVLAEMNKTLFPYIDEEPPLMAKSVSLLFRHKNSQDLSNSKEYYEVHTDPASVYLRVLLPLVGPGTKYFIGSGEKQTAEGDILILSGAGRYANSLFESDLLPHQSPDLSGQNVDRLLLRIDFQSSFSRFNTMAPSPIQRIIEFFR